jgi:hypothetical protein
MWSLLNSEDGWLAIGVSALFVIAGLVMRQVFIRVLKQDAQAPKHD